MYLLVDFGMLSQLWTMSPQIWSDDTNCVAKHWHRMCAISFSVANRRCGSVADSDASNSEWSVHKWKMKIICGRKVCPHKHRQHLHVRSHPIDCWWVWAYRMKWFVSSMCCPVTVNRDAHECVAVILDPLYQPQPNWNYFDGWDNRSFRWFHWSRSK